MVARFVNEFFLLNGDTCDKLHRMKPNFGYDGFGEIVFYRTYSRIKPDGGQESWADVVIRVINGCMTIRKDWYIKNAIKWDDEYWQKYATGMALSMFRMEWLPPGRGMWAMGTPFVYDKGAMALNNCGFTKLGGNSRLSDDLHWLMDALMLGVGVGFEPVRDDLKIYTPVGYFDHYVQDSREGWADSLKLLVDAFTKPGCRKPRFKYDLVRDKGLLIKGFGGKASGPEPLKVLHRQVEEFFTTPGIDVVRLKTDIGNAVGCCVVAGNVRRSAELAKGMVGDQVFLDLKDYEKYPEREDWGYMSNNTVALYHDRDFEALGEVARRVVVRGEPGILNLRNFKYGRLQKLTPVKEDKADGLNPCGEIPLEDKELCNVVETIPTRCANVETWYRACEYATTYACSVSLLPTHREETNRVVVRNRRIGVGIIDWTGWIHAEGMHKVTSYMRKGYDVVTKASQLRNEEAGVPEPIRKTTVKPGGTAPKLPGKTSGIGYPTFRETLRRMRVAANNPICPVLDRAGVPFEADYYDPVHTRIYQYPTVQGPALPADQISLWEQMMNLICVQREWADNAVSNTLYFKPKWKLTYWRDGQVIDDEWQVVIHKETGCVDLCAEFQEWAKNPSKPFTFEDYEFKIKCKQNKYGTWEFALYEFDPAHEEDQIEKVLSMGVPHLKSCSLLPHAAKGAYRQMPEEGITTTEYEARRKAIKPIDWRDFRNSDGEDEKFCQGDACVVPSRTGS